MLRSSSSDRAKVVVSVCAIVSSALTLAAYFGALDFATRVMVQARHVPATIFDAKTMSDTTLFPAELGQFISAPTAAS